MKAKVLVALDWGQIGETFRRKAEILPAVSAESRSCARALLKLSRCQGRATSL